jgi:ABC-type antimicrobial peptide transport system permease subunit
VIGLLALAVAVIGTYSVVGYVASQRRHEIGVRMALGARAAHIARIVVSDAVAMVAVGLVAGIAAAFAFGSLIEALLYETSAREPGVIVTVAILLLLAAGLAALVPAWRATRVDPTEALRSE